MSKSKQEDTSNADIKKVQGAASSEEASSEAADVTAETVDDALSKSPGKAPSEAPNDAPEGQDPEKKKTPVILKILGILMIIVAVFAVPALVLIIVSMFLAPEVFSDELGVTTFVITIVLIVTLLINAILGAIFGVNLLRNRRRNARRISEILIVATVASMICELMLSGLSVDLFTYFIRLVILIVIATYIDPTLSEERKVQRKLRKMETREQAEEGTLGRDETGKGFIKLDFFNIFWIFVIACVVGVVIETIYHAIMFGGYQDRAGMLYGPFSPIYGFGAVLMTIALNRFYKKNFIIIFLVSALIGGAFEFAVSWFLEFAFGIVAWDYTGTFLSIDGRTNGMYMFFWGLLGCLWIKLILPYVLKLVNLIPWNWRYTVTTICAVLMIVNGGLTLAAYDCWYKRQAGTMIEQNALEKFCNQHYDDKFMEERFQSMSIDPDKSTRTDTSQTTS